MTSDPKGNFFAVAARMRLMVFGRKAERFYHASNAIDIIGAIGKWFAFEKEEGPVSCFYRLAVAQLKVRHCAPDAQNPPGPWKGGGNPEYRDVPSDFLR